MSDCSIVKADDGYEIAGELNFNNAAKVLDKHPSLPASESSIAINVDGLSEIDSAGLSVLLHWLRAANKNDQSIELQGKSNKLSTLISVAGLSDLL